MITKLFPLLLCVLLTSCNSSNDKNDDKVSTIITTENQLEPLHPDSLLLQNIQNTTCSFDVSELTRPTSIYLPLEGKIDNNYAVEMFLFYDTTEAINTKNIVPIVGSYRYLTHNNLISLQGKLNRDTWELNLYSEKNKVKDEIFTGKYTPNLNTFSGTWDKLSKNKKMPFELKAIPKEGANTPLWMQYVFALKLNDILKTSGSDYSVSADSVGIDKQGIYIRNLKSTSSSLTTTSLEAHNSYSDDKFKGENDVEVEIWRFENSDMFLIYVHCSNSGAEIATEEDGTEEFLYGYGGDNFELWKYSNHVFEDILVFGREDLEFEDDYDYSEDIAKMDWYAVREDNIITVFEKSTNKSWIWDTYKQKFMLKK